MSYRYESHTYENIAKHELGTNLAIRFALEDIRQTAEPKTPKKTGELRSSAIILANKGVVNWTSDHAEIMENKEFPNYTTPGTGPHFARNAVKEVEQRFDQHLRRAGVIQ